MQFRFTEPAENFSDGVAVLRSYHDCMLRQGEALLQLAMAIRDGGITEDLANQAVAMHTFYTRANWLHHRDEEQCLFPALLDNSPLMDGMIERLALDHEEIEQAWEQLAPFLATPEAIDDRQGLWERARSFEKLQREHLTRENEDFLPEVSTQLSDCQRTQIGQRMAEIRGLDCERA